MDLGPHAVFIVMAYAATGLIVTGLILRAVFDYRTQARALASLESRGMRRRSDSPSVSEAGGRASSEAPR